MQTQMATSFQVRIISLPKWLYLLVFLVAVRVVLSLIALTATHFIPIQGRDVIESLGIQNAVAAWGMGALGFRLLFTNC